MSSQKALYSGITPPAPERVYSNQGNPPLIDLLGKGCKRLLDIGCGAGDNAALVKSRYSEYDVFGITPQLGSRHRPRILDGRVLMRAVEQ